MHPSMNSLEPCPNRPENKPSPEELLVFATKGFLALANEAERIRVRLRFVRRGR